MKTLKKDKVNKEDSEITGKIVYGLNEKGVFIIGKVFKEGETVIQVKNEGGKHFKLKKWFDVKGGRLLNPKTNRFVNDNESNRKMLREMF